MATKNSKPTNNQPERVEPAKPAEPAKAAKNMRGTFCNLEKYGSNGWGIQIEEDGDVAPGQLIDVRRKDGEVKAVTIDEVIFEDPWKVVCTVRRDPNDKPANSRKGAVKRGGDLGADGEDPRPTRKGKAAWKAGDVRGADSFVDLGGTRIKRGLISADDLFDL